MQHHRRADSRPALIAVAAVALVASGCACMYGVCGATTESLQLNGQRCYPLEGTSGTWTLGAGLGAEGAPKLHRFNGRDTYATCFTYRGKKGTPLSVAVESSDFEPEIILAREGENGTEIATGAGDRTARISLTIPANGNYALIVTSRRARDTGRFGLRYSTSSR